MCQREVSKENKELKLKESKQEDKRSFAPLRGTKDQDRCRVIQQVEEKKGEEHKNIEAERPRMWKKMSGEKAFIASIAIEIAGILILTTGIAVALVKGITFELDTNGLITAGWLITTGTVITVIGSTLSSLTLNKGKKTTQQKSES